MKYQPMRMNLDITDYDIFKAIKDLKPDWNISKIEEAKLFCIKHMNYFEIEDYLKELIASQVKMMIKDVE